MNDYYMEFILCKLKKEIFTELSENNLEKEEIQKCVNEYFHSNEILFEEEDVQKLSVSHPIRDRCLYKDKKEKCIARIWNEGHGGQCSCKGKSIYNGYCKTHFKKGGEKDEWWLGRIDGRRPERPFHPDGFHKNWKNK